ncbi:hypothetical protein [Acetobacter pomorum]|uniref:hypothetical protein n=1 Tax=Acetobacter pomorum TaxID=65959 RepID=UPI00142E0A77|nr:hypothetical protein [Acetobacter pomorum]
MGIDDAVLICLFLFGNLAKVLKDCQQNARCTTIAFVSFRFLNVNHGIKQAISWAIPI